MRIAIHGAQYIYFFAAIKFNKMWTKDIFS